MKEFCLDEQDAGEGEVVVMRSDRLSPLTKPRSVTRQNSDDAAQGNQADKISSNSIREFDLQKGDIFTIADLKPLQTKEFENLDAYPYAFKQDKDVLSWATALISESALGQALLKEVENSRWKIMLNDLGTGGFHLDAFEKIIELDNYGLDAASLGQSAFFRTSLICVLAKALRDIWHENRWGAFENMYNPESVLMLERARAADADSVSVLIGYELRSAGYNDVWRHILGSDDGDMAQVLTNILERYPTALYNGMALAHIFRQWYADVARVDALDHDTLEHLDFSMRDFDGNNAFDFGDKKIKAIDLENLSTLPDGTVYLKELGETVCRDPFFCGLNDPINQAHLFQIVYDSKVTYVDGIPFRDPSLARKFIKPD
ncbi:MAG TPA: hypothetical protein PLF01_03255 [Alphaproteobacteria bacterium]|nr:hypothetical protein [Alphaproteobacteria bacterium]